MKYFPVQYARALHDIASEAPVTKRRETIREFLETVAKNGSLNLIPDIIREFELLVDTESGIRHVVISTPERLAEGAVARKLPFSAKVKALRDARLHGGTVVEVDDLRIDNSVAMRMERARKAFTK